MYFLCNKNIVKNKKKYSRDYKCKRDKYEDTKRQIMQRHDNCQVTTDSCLLHLYSNYTRMLRYLRQNVPILETKHNNDAIP